MPIKIVICRGHYAILQRCASDTSDPEMRLGPVCIRATPLLPGDDLDALFKTISAMNGFALCKCYTREYYYVKESRFLRWVWPPTN